MNKIFLAIVLYVFTFCGNPKAENNAEVASAKNTKGNKAILGGDSADIQINTCIKINTINNLVRDNKLSRKAAADSLKTLIALLNSLYAGVDTSKAAYVFPIAGYTKNNIGGKNGNGYVAGNYSYFDGNKHGGHPAHDIFVNDKNQDGKDDKTQSAFFVRAFTKGIVVSLAEEWDSTSTLRGGKYLWLYNAADSTLTYYAHNNTLLVKLGDEVQPGDTIATVGRTGFNAFKKRSPTHLHFMQLKFNKNMLPEAINPYQKLVNARVD